MICQCLCLVVVCRDHPLVKGHICGQKFQEWAGSRVCLFVLVYQSLLYILFKVVKIRSRYGLAIYVHPVVHVVIQRFQLCPHVVVIMSQVDTI